MTCILCKLFYALGDFWSQRFMPLVPDSWDRLGMALVRPYHWFMQWSVNMDDRGGCGVWGYADDLVADLERDQDQVGDDGAK